jgi:hypothetical protein
LNMMLDRELWEETVPGGGWASIHAAGLLFDLRAPDALEPMLDLLGELSVDLVLFNTLALRLPEYGESALEPLLRRCALAEDEDALITFAFPLSELGVRDPRALEVFRELLPDHPAAAVGMLGSYGDPSGIEDILELAHGLTPDTDEGTRFVAIECRDALDALEALSGPVEAHLTRCIKGSAVSTKVGRNALCPCGSGKKYKRCCGSPQAQV